jgi:gamma-glutamylcyclotransferase (GGCT)/AIG2-like uncharacterized protein YtfP
MLRVFVYGTLKPGQVNYARYCGDLVLHSIPAQVRGQLFELCLGYPGMTLGETWVQGYLLLFADESVLEALDRLEDYQPHRLEAQNEYQRIEVEVFDREGQKPLSFAWTYFMMPHKVKQYDGRLIASGEWQPQ